MPEKNRPTEGSSQQTSLFGQWRECDGFHIRRVLIPDQYQLLPTSFTGTARLLGRWLHPDRPHHEQESKIPFSLFAEDEHVEVTGYDALRYSEARYQGLALHALIRRLELIAGQNQLRATEWGVAERLVGEELAEVLGDKVQDAAQFISEQSAEWKHAMLLQPLEQYQKSMQRPGRGEVIATELPYTIQLRSKKARFKFSRDARSDPDRDSVAITGIIDQVRLRRGVPEIYELKLHAGEPTPLHALQLLMHMLALQTLSADKKDSELIVPRMRLRDLTSDREFELVITDVDEAMDEVKHIIFNSHISIQEGYLKLADEIDRAVERWPEKEREAMRTKLERQKAPASISGHTRTGADCFRTAKKHQDKLEKLCVWIDLEQEFAPDYTQGYLFIPQDSALKLWRIPTEEELKKRFPDKDKRTFYERIIARDPPDCGDCHLPLQRNLKWKKSSDQAYLPCGHDNMASNQLTFYVQ